MNRCKAREDVQEDESIPVVVSPRDDGRADIGSDQRRGSVGDAKQAEEHSLVAWRGELGHHRLRVGVIRRLAETEEHVVQPELPRVVETIRLLISI